MTVRSLLLVAGMLVLLPAASSSAAPAAAATAPAPALSSAKARAASAVPEVSDAWIAEAPPGARHNAAYLTLRNGSRADTLLAVESPVAEVAELHAMQEAGGLLRMRRETSLALPPGARVQLAPGGRHIMLINKKRSLPLGAKVPLRLRFRRAGVISVEAEVRPLPVDIGDDHAGHHHGH